MPPPGRRRTMSKVFFAALAFASFATAHAQKWDMPTPYSGGELDIVVHSNGSLIKHPDILRAVSTGQVPVAEFLLGQFGNEDPIFEADNIPFVAPGYDAAWKFYQAQKPLLEQHLGKRGVTLLYSVAWPGQGIYTKEPLKSV